MEKYQIDKDRIIMIEPQGYHEFLYLIMNAKGLITDSGGITEEATVLNIPASPFEIQQKGPKQLRWEQMNL